jgi:hypothetical protein
VAGFEPLPVLVNQADQRDLGIKPVSGQAGDHIQCRIGRCIKHSQRPQGGKALRFVKQYGWRGKIYH